MRGYLMLLCAEESCRLTTVYIFQIIQSPGLLVMQLVLKTKQENAIQKLMLNSSVQGRK